MLVIFLVFLETKKGTLEKETPKWGSKLPELGLTCLFTRRNFPFHMVAICNPPFNKEHTKSNIVYFGNCAKPAHQSSNKLNGSCQELEGPVYLPPDQPLFHIREVH